MTMRKISKRNHPTAETAREELQRHGFIYPTHPLEAPGTVWRRKVGNKIDKRGFMVGEETRQRSSRFHLVEYPCR